MSKLSVNVKVSIAALIVVLGIIVIAMCQSPGTSDFQLHRARYEQIVAKVKTRGIEPGSETRENRLWTSADLDAASLALKRKNNVDMVGMIEVFRDASGSYGISITTLDNGHFGTYGYVYADTADTFPTNINMYLTPQRQVAPHWWIAENKSW